MLGLVVEQIQRWLDGNVLSLPVSLLPSARGMAEVNASPLSLLDSQLGAEAL